MTCFCTPTCLSSTGLSRFVRKKAPTRPQPWPEILQYPTVCAMCYDTSNGGYRLGPAPRPSAPSGVHATTRCQRLDTTPAAGGGQVACRSAMAMAPRHLCSAMNLLREAPPAGRRRRQQQQGQFLPVTTGCVPRRNAAGANDVRSRRRVPPAAVGARALVDPAFVTVPPPPVPPVVAETNPNPFAKVTSRGLLLQCL